MLKATVVCVAIVSSLGVVSTSDWRTSFDAFITAIAAVPIGDIPRANSNVSQADVDRDKLTGLRVSGDRPIMKRFGGPVEFEGTLEGVSPEWNSALAAPTKREKVDLKMVWPAGSHTKLWAFHVYAKPSSVAAWRALTPNTPVRFRANVTGITWNAAYIPTAPEYELNIVLEDAEIVSK